MMNMVIMLEILRVLHISATEYLKYRLTDDKYHHHVGEIIPQTTIDGGGIFQIILASEGIAATEDIVSGILAFYVPMATTIPIIRRVDGKPRQGAAAFVAALPSVSSIPEYDVQCPLCWEGWAEAQQPHVNHTVKKTPCGHLFGHDCLLAAIQTAGPRLCPMCRRDMS